MITKDLRLAQHVLENNDIIAIPTETVYGLAGNALSEVAVQKIFDLKKRPSYNPIIVHIGSIEVLTKVAKDIPQVAYQLAEAFWPGPLTLVLNKQDNVPNLVTAGKSTVAVRMPSHPLILDLLKLLPFPLAAPSANPFGSISPTTAQHVSDYFEHNLEVVLDGGPCQRGIESTIIGFENNTPILYRLGSISEEDIEAVVGHDVKRKTLNDSTPSAPGMLSRHYAPNTDTFLSENIEEALGQHTGKRIGLLLFKNRVYNKSVVHQEILAANGDLNLATQNLYAAMHRLDKMRLDVIIAEKLPEAGLGKSINDRLQRAIKK